jgi:hypothetical protein
VFSCVPTHKRLLVVLLVVMVSEKVLVDLKVSQEEKGGKHVGKIGVLRNVVAHSVGSGFLVGHQSWIEKHLQESQTVDVDFVDYAGLKVEWNERTNMTEETGQRTWSVVRYRVLHLALQLVDFAPNLIQNLSVAHYYVCSK